VRAVRLDIGRSTLHAAGIESITDEQLRQAYAVREAAHRDAAPMEPLSPYPQWAGLVRQVPAGTLRWHWLLDGGYADLTTFDSSAIGYIDLRVAPSHRRKGLGSALLASVLAVAGAHDVDRILGRFADPGSEAFARVSGATVGNRTIHSVLTLPAPVTPRPVPGFTVTSWTDRAPDALLTSYAESRHAINDAPHTDADRDEVWTPTRIREFEEIVAVRGRQTRVTAVLDGTRVVGFTELRVSFDHGVIASTEDTAILTEHRGLGLAAWMKSVSLGLLQRDRPDVTGVLTGNDATNAPMLAVNRRLGFQPVATWTDAVLPIPANRRL
jgi:GNAT superfamily N-acetyltransferase